MFGFRSIWGVVVVVVVVVRVVELTNKLIPAQFSGVSEASACFGSC